MSDRKETLKAILSPTKQALINVQKALKALEHLPHTTEPDWDIAEITDNLRAAEQVLQDAEESLKRLILDEIRAEPFL